MDAVELKVILLGESAVGKTSFMIQFAESRFKDEYLSTLGLEWKIVPMVVNGTPVNLQIWDVSTRQRVVHRYLKAIKGVVIMYDVTKKKTFDEVPWWLKETEEYFSGVPIFLVGNKSDGGGQQEVPQELAQDLAKENKLNLYNASARDNVNVKQVFEQLVAVILEDRKNAMVREEIMQLMFDQKFEQMRIEMRLDDQNVTLGEAALPSKKNCCGCF